MKYITLDKISDYSDKTVILKGWLYNKRSSGKIAFLQFRDGTGMIQAVVVKSEVDKNVFEMVKGLTLESSIEIVGKAVEDKRAPSGFEIQVSDVNLVHLSPDDYPIGKKDHGPDFLLSNRHLWLRSRRQWALMKIRSRVFRAVDCIWEMVGTRMADKMAIIAMTVRTSMSVKPFVIAAVKPCLSMLVVWAR